MCQPPIPKLLILVEGSYCWEVVGGRTVSPCPHVHSTSRLSIFAWAGKKQRIPFSPRQHGAFSHSLQACSSSRTRWKWPSSRKDVLFSSRTGWDPPSFSLRRELEKPFTVTHDFPVKEPFTIWVCYCSPHELWFAEGSFTWWLLLVHPRIWLWLV